MNSEWQRVALDELYDFSSGLSKPRSAFGSGYPFLSFKDVFYNSAVPTQLTELVNSTSQERERCSVARGDVFLTRTSETMDELGMSCVALTDIADATFNGFTKRLRPKHSQRVVPEFARYYFRSPEFRSDVTAMTSMSTRASLNNEMLSRLYMVLPSHAEQGRIGQALGALDDRISLLRETNKTLESIAQAIFKSWFVDFDPVRAKIEGHQPEGMDEETAALFPDSFEESALGATPLGWRVMSIGDAIESVGGATPDTKNSDFWTPAIHCWTTPKDLSGIAAPILLDTERKLSEKGIIKISSGLLPKGTLLLSSRAPIGYLALAQVPLAINQGYIAMLPGGLLPPIYLLFWCRENMETIKGRANGSTFMEISKKAFRPIPVLLPSSGLVDRFVEIASTLFARLIENEKQAQTLSSLRNNLLPKLISGQLRLPEAQEQVENALT